MNLLPRKQWVYQWRLRYYLKKSAPFLLLAVLVMVLFWQLPKNTDQQAALADAQEQINALQQTLQQQAVSVSTAASEPADNARQTPAGVHYEQGMMSVQVRDQAVCQTLQALAQSVGLNMSLHASVSGQITVNLSDVPWQDALNVILQSAGLAQRTLNDIVYIAPSDLIAEQESSVLQAQAQQQALQPLQTHYMRIHYAQADQLAALIKSKDNSLLSERGQVSVDARTNTLIIKDLPEPVYAVQALVAELDKPVQQVMIQARIINASESFSRDLGLKFSIDGHIDLAQSSSAFYHDLPSYQTAPMGLAITTLTDNLLIDLEISAAERENKTRVVASPRLITANQSEAVIRQGKQIAVEEQTPTGATSVSFRDAVLELGVTPHITPDDRIILHLDVKQDVLGQFTENGQPTIDTKSIRTQVLVDDKATVVLGGIYSQTESNHVQRLPFFKQLPILGKIFQDKSTLNEKDELLIFVTPTIVKEHEVAS